MVAKSRASKSRTSQNRVTLTILGSGTSTGVPLIGCKCSVCRSKNPKNRRTRASAWIQTQGKSFLIDTSTDLREQALRERIQKVDAVLYTHPHADHISGIDELRCYNFLQKSTIPVYANEWTRKDLESRYSYIFSPQPVEGGGIPQLHIKKIQNSRMFKIQGVPIQPIPLQHGSREIYGFRIGPVAYVTDCSYIPAESIRRLRGLSVLVLDCVRIKPHRTHLNLERALETASELQARKTFLTHLGHDFDESKWSRKLPPGIALAYDGLKIRA